MRALVKENGVPGLGLRDREAPRAATGIALVEVRCAGICGTDLLFYTGRRPLPAPRPVVLGHEVAAVVRELPAPDPEGGLRVGDHVTVEMVTGCGVCPSCRDDYKLACPENTRIGITVDGGFADYAAVPVASLRRLPPEVTFARATFADPLACAYKGIEKLSRVAATRVLILGAGMMGMLCLQLLRRTAGVDEVVLLDRHPERRTLGRRWGATPVADLSDAAVRAAGFDVVVEASGNLDLFTAGLSLLRPRGVLLLLGVHLQTPLVDTHALLQREIEIIPSLCYGRRHMEAAIDLLAGGGVDVESLISAVAPLEQHERAFELALRKQSMKVLFDLEGRR